MRDRMEASINALADVDLPKVAQQLLSTRSPARPYVIQFRILCGRGTVSQSLSDIDEMSL